MEGKMIDWGYIKENGWSLKKQDEIRILSLDGGGIRGVFTAQLLADIEKDTGKNIIDFFDLIVGTSTGGIIAMALSIGIPAKEIVSLYSDNADKIFKLKSRALKGKAGRLFMYKYDNSGLQELLKEKFHEHKMQDALVNLCITSVEHREACPRVYKTPHNERLHLDAEKEMWRVAMATSAAPTYFPAVNVLENECNLDGGLWANNPAVVGILEALDNKGSLDKIKVLSIGTGENPYSVQNDIAEEGNLLKWGTDIAGLFMNCQTHSANNAAKFLIKNNLTRIDFKIDNEYTKIEMDSTDSKALEELKRVADRIFQNDYKNGENLSGKFFTL